jgi:hypothetical protein
VTAMMQKETGQRCRVNQCRESMLRLRSQAVLLLEDLGQPIDIVLFERRVVGNSMLSSLIRTVPRNNRFRSA